MSETPRSSSPQGAEISASFVSAVLTASAGARGHLGALARGGGRRRDVAAVPRCSVVLAERGEPAGQRALDALHHSSVDRDPALRPSGAQGAHRSTGSVESRREVAVALSAAGSTLIGTVTNQRRAEINRIVRRMPVPARRELIAAFGAFADAAGELPDDVWKLGVELVTDAPAANASASARLSALRGIAGRSKDCAATRSGGRRGHGFGRCHLRHPRDEGPHQGRRCTALGRRDCAVRRPELRRGQLAMARRPSDAIDRGRISTRSTTLDIA